MTGYSASTSAAPTLPASWPGSRLSPARRPRPWLARTSGEAPAPVPREFLGLARDLRRRLAAADAQVAPGLEHALRPLRERLERRPTLRADLLTDAERHWRQGVPGFGRLVLAAERRRGRVPYFCELRAQAGAFRFATWPPGFEPGLLLVLILAEPRPGGVDVRQTPLAAVSLHALARRYQRGGDCSEAAIFGDLADLAPFAQETGLPPAVRFALPLAHGCWCGERVQVDGRMVLAVRTYLGAFTARLSGSGTPAVPPAGRPIAAHTRC